MRAASRRANPWFARTDGSRALVKVALRVLEERGPIEPIGAPNSLFCPHFSWTEFVSNCS
jgi:hypothetical protein